jgi:flagellin
MRELAVQGANDTNVTEDRWSIYEEMSQLASEINRIGCTTEFNTMKLFASDKQIQEGTTNFKAGGVEDTETTEGLLNDLQNNDYMSDAGKKRNEHVISLANLSDPETEFAKLQVGANSMQAIKFQMNTLDVTKLNAPGIAQDDSEKVIDLSSESGTLNKIHEQLMAAEEADNFSVEVHKVFTAAVTDIDVAITNISKSRSYLGAVQNRLEHTIANADNTAENLQAAESRIRDVNMAEQMVQYSKDSILQQAGQSMLAQANQSTQGVLSLLR